ncbi:suppressor of IKBKE 1 isoform 1-T1 [Guaruba guarouba]
MGTNLGRFRLDIRKKFFLVRVVRHWHRVPKDAVNTPSLAVFKAKLDRASGHMVLRKVSLLVAGGWKGVIFKALSNPNCSVILCFYALEVATAFGMASWLADGSRQPGGALGSGGIPPSKGASGTRKLGNCQHGCGRWLVVCGNEMQCFAELWISLEEHQDALELIMSKYRKQMLQLLQGRKSEDAEPALNVHQTNSLEIESQIDRICEMGEVMRKAVQVDDDQFFKVQEKLAQLELENKELRELLSISKESFEVGREDLPDCEA